MRGAGEQQAPPKPDDGEDEQSPVAGGRWRPSQYPGAGAPAGSAGPAVGRLEDKLNGCVGSSTPAGGSKPRSRYLELLSMPAAHVTVRLRSCHRPWDADGDGPCRGVEP